MTVGSSVRKRGAAGVVIAAATMPTIHRNCDGSTRRDFLKLGVGAFAGLGMVDLLRHQAVAADVARAAGAPPPKPVNCIMVWLDGGPSHYESFDPKPDAPTEVRGEYKTIPTKVP